RGPGADPDLPRQRTGAASSPARPGRVRAREQAEAQADADHLGGGPLRPRPLHAGELRRKPGRHPRPGRRRVTGRPVSVSPDTLLETAVEGARRAGRVLAERIHQPRTISFKGGIDLVTDADKASDKVLLEWLRERHPDHAILSEESGASAGSSYRWIIDPLDGTTNYAHQLPHFSVTIAVEGEGGLQVGVVYDPMRDEMFSAVRGRGATLNGKPIRRSLSDRLA